MNRTNGQGNITLIGAGGNIGSQVVPHLARMPAVQSATLVDPDVYEARNLRGQNIYPCDVGCSKVRVQARNLKAINPSLHVVPLPARVEDVPLGLLRGKALLAGLDSKLARMRMNRIGARLGGLVIDAGIRRDGLLGRITVCDPARGTACLECGWDSAQYRGLPRRTPCLDADPVAPATDAPSELGAVIGSYQIIECRKLLAAAAGAPPSAYQVLIDLVNHKVTLSALPLNPRCRCDHRRWDIRPIEADPAAMTANDLLDRCAAESKSPPTALGMYGKVFVLGATCPDCGARRTLHRLNHRLTDDELTCSRCVPQTGHKMIVAGPDAVERIDRTDHADLVGRPLGEVGFRAHDVVTVYGPDGDVHYELLPPAKPGPERGGDASE